MRMEGYAIYAKFPTRPMRCDRCCKVVGAVTESWFTVDEMICWECHEKEVAHPDFECAKAAEEDAARRGDFDFPGIGKPADL